MFEQLFKILKSSTQSHGNKLSAFTKWELTIITKLLVFKLVLIPIITRGHGFWEMTERMLPQLQAVPSVKRPGKVRSCEIHEALNVELLSI